MDNSQSLLLNGSSLLGNALPDDPLLKGISSYGEDKSSILTRAQSQDSAFSDPMSGEIKPLAIDSNYSNSVNSTFENSFASASPSSFTGNGYGSDGDFVMLSNPSNQDFNSDSTTDIDPLTGNPKNSSLTNPDNKDSLTTFKLAANNAFAANSLSSSSVSQGKFGDFDGGNDVALEIKDDQGKVIETFSLTGDGYGEVFKDDKYLYVDFEGTDETTSVQISAINNLKLEDFLGSSLKVQTEGYITAGDITLQNTDVSDGNGLVLRSGLGEDRSWTLDRYNITDLGDGNATDISNSGQVLVNNSFLYSDGKLINLTNLFGDDYHPSAMSDSGQVLIHSYKGSFLYNAGQITNLGTLSTSGNNAAVFDINNAKQIVGSSGLNAVVYNNGQMKDLGHFPDDGEYKYLHSTAFAVNNNGQIVGEYSVGTVIENTGIFDGYDRAFLYSNGQITNLGTLPGGTGSRAVDINDSGQIIGSSYRYSSSERAFLYSNGQMTDLGALFVDNDDFSLSRAYSINNSGQIVGFSNGNAFLYEDGKMTDLNSLIPSGSDWTLTDAQAINDKGQIVGWGELEGKDGSRAFLLNPTTTFTATPEEGITVGNISTLGNSVEMQGLKITLNGSSITTNGGKITLDAPTLLNSPTNEFKFDSTVSADGSGGGDITIKNTFDGYIAGTQSLTLKAGQGNIIFDKAIGSSATLKDFTVNGAKTFAANGDLTSEGNITLKVIDDIRTANLSTNDASTINISLGKIDEQIFDSTGNVTTGSIKAKELEVLSDGAFTASGKIEALNGDVNILTLKDISVAQMTAQNGGISLTSGIGSITATGAIDSHSGFSALSKLNITTGEIKSTEDAVILKSHQGAISVNGAITSYGDVSLAANKDVVARQITSQDGGVALVSESATVKANGAISSIEDITLAAVKNVASAQNLRAQIGTIILASTQGSVNANGLINAGIDVAISAKQNITTKRIGSQGGAIALKTELGRITTTGDILSNGGEIYLSSVGIINSKNFISKGGAINLISSKGSLITGYLRSDKGAGNGGKIYLEAAGLIKVTNSVSINGTKYSIYTGVKKKDWVSIVYQSGLDPSQKSKFVIGKPGNNGTIAGVFGGANLISLRRDIPPLPIWELIRELLREDPSSKDPSHVNDINPITDKPYRDDKEREFVKELTEEQQDTLKDIINNKTVFSGITEDEVFTEGKVDDKDGCFSLELTGHLGDGSIGVRAAAARYATWVSGSPNDFLVIDREGNEAFYDGIVNQGGAGYSVIQSVLGSTPYPIGTVVVVEAKLGYEWLNKFIRPSNQLPASVTRLPNIAYDPTPREQWQINTYNRIVNEINKQAKVAKNCGLLFFVSFNRYQAYGSGLELFSYTPTKVIDRDNFADVRRVPNQGQTSL